MSKKQMIAISLLLAMIPVMVMWFVSGFIIAKIDDNSLVLQACLTYFVLDFLLGFSRWLQAWLHVDAFEKKGTFQNLSNEIYRGLKNEIQ